MLLCIALLPLLPHAHHWWESNRAKLTVALALRGAVNLLWLAGVVLAVAGLVDGRALPGTDRAVPPFLREGVVLALAGLSW
jgi:hypothetical protein